MVSSGSSSSYLALGLHCWRNEEVLANRNARGILDVVFWVIR